MAYRTAELRVAKPIRIAAGRAWGIMLALVAAALGLTMIGFLFGDAVRLECDRGRDICVLSSLHGPRIVTSRREIRIGKIERAGIVTSRGEDGTTTGISLTYDGQEHVLVGYSGGAAVSEHEKEVWAREVNDFLADSKRPRLDVEYSSLGIFWGTAAIAVICIAAAIYASRRAVVVVDRAARRIVFTGGLPRRRRSYDLTGVFHASVENDVIVLMRHDDPPIAVDVLAGFDYSAKAALAGRIAAVLAEA